LTSYIGTFAMKMLQLQLCHCGNYC